MSATIHSFPPRRVQPYALDFSRATPADDAAIDQLRANTRAALAARTQADRDELIAALLLAMEASPLARPHCYPVRQVLTADDAGRAHVIVMVAGQPFRLRPDDCRKAADSLIAEQAFPGCVGVAGDLREAAALAEIRSPQGGPLDRESETSGRTGFVSTAILAGLILLMLAVSAGAGL
jgi:hypothetical protein